MIPANVTIDLPPNEQPNAFLPALRFPAGARYRLEPGPLRAKACGDVALYTAGKDPGYSLARIPGSGEEGGPCEIGARQT